VPAYIGYQGHGLVMVYLYQALIQDGFSYNQAGGTIRSYCRQAIRQHGPISLHLYHMYRRQFIPLAMYSTAAPFSNWEVYV
jgi:hypothetical protein